MKKHLLFALAIATSFTTLGGGGEKIEIRINKKPVKALAHTFYLKPGAYQAPPKVDYKRDDLHDIEVVVPKGDFPETDSITVQLIGYAGASALYREKANVAPGQAVIFQLDEPVKRDFNPNGKQPQLLGRLDVEATPIKRANVHGQYKGSITIK